MSPNTALFVSPSFVSLAKSSSSNLSSSSSTRAVSSSSKKKEQTAAGAAPSPRHARPTSTARHPASDPLPQECELLKQKIRQVHPEKTSRFSLSAMKRIAIPPVDIPDAFTNAPTIVAGKRVLFTKSSWMRRRHELRLLRRIRENDVLR